MPDLSDALTVRLILKKHGFSFSKTLGQNFIVDGSVCPRMAELSGVDGECGALEIGPGIGVLTKELAKRAKKVVALELDDSLRGVLGETMAPFDNVEIVWGDVLKLDLPALVKEKFGDMPFVVCANLPYYITSPVIMKLLESRLGAKSLTVMVQKEVADRLCAGVGSRQAGAVTVAVAYHSRPEKLFDVPASCFLPAPKVNSAVIRMDIRDVPDCPVKDEKLFFSVVKAAFAMRRKTALNALSSGLGMPKEAVASAIGSAGLRPDIRGEKLTLEQFAVLTDALARYREIPLKNS